MLAWPEDFSQAAWSKLGGGTGAIPVITAGQADPLGGTSAVRIQFDKGAGTTINDRSILDQLIASGFTNPHDSCVSLWAKSNDGSSHNLMLRDPQSNAVGQSAVQIAVTTAWQQFSHAFTAVPSSGSEIQFGLRGTLFTDNTADVLIWHPQLNDGTPLLGYAKNTDRLSAANGVAGGAAATWTACVQWAKGLVFSNGTTSKLTLPARPTVWTRVIVSDHCYMVDSAGRTWQDGLAGSFSVPDVATAGAGNNGRTVTWLADFAGTKTSRDAMRLYQILKAAGIAA